MWTSRLLKFLLKSDANFSWLIHSQFLILIPSNFTDLFPIFISICIFSDIILSLPWKEFISIQLSVPASPHFKLCTIKKGFYEHKKIECAKKCINTLFKIINLKNHRKMHIKNCKMLFVITLKYFFYFFQMHDVLLQDHFLPWKYKLWSASFEETIFAKIAQKKKYCKRERYDFEMKRNRKYCM